MLKTKIRYRLFVITLILLVSAVIPTDIAGASSNDPPAAVVKLTPGVGKITVNGVAVSSEKPYLSGKVLYIPLRTVMEAFGADVVWQGDNKTEVYFKNVSAELTIGKPECLVNQDELTLSAPMVYRNGTIMAPSDFVTRAFDITGSTKGATGETTFTLENDGALTDLSFLTGSLNRPRAGNSFFGWSLALPKGSVLTSRTFNSKTVQFENDYHSIAIDMVVELSEGKSLEDHYGALLDDPYPFIKAELMDSRLSADSSPAFIELFYADSYDEAIYHRIYYRNGYFYNLIITSADKSNPQLLLEDAAVKDMLASFSLDYKGDSPDTSDLSKVSYGLAPYSNYITSDTTGKKFASWEMSILPDWDLMPAGGESPYITQFGTGKREYVSVEVSPAGDKTAEETGKNIKSGYEKNFNPALFSLKSEGMSEAAGLLAYSMLFEVRMGKTLYTYEEKVLSAGGLTYDITFKTPSASYEKKKEGLGSMLETFKPYGKDAEALSAQMEKYRFNSEKNRLGKDDSPVLSENKTFSWSLSLPGNWQKSSMQGQSMETFFNTASGAMITVEAVPKKDASSGRPDEERFSSMSLVSGLGLEPAKVESVQGKGGTVKVYKYRIDNEATDDYADVSYYIIEGRNYWYCYMSSIPDLTSGGANLSVMSAAWDSFNIGEKSGEN